MVAITMDGTGERREAARWLGAFALAALVHAGAITGLAQWRSSEETAPGEQEIAIDLAPAMVEAPSLEAMETTRAADAPGESGAVAPPSAETPTEIWPETAAIGPPAADPPPPEAAAPAKPPETVAAAPVDPVTAETPPALETALTAPEAVKTTTAEADRPVEPPVAAETIAPPEAEPSRSEVVVASLPPEETEAETADPVAVRLPPEAVTAEAPRQPPPVPPKPVVRRRVSEPKGERVRPRETRPARTAAASPITSGSIPSRASTGRASPDDFAGRAAAADPDAFRRYTAELAAALKRRLRYPENARDAGIRGTATLRFTLHRSGRIVSASLVRSAGHPALDQAAMATVAPGSSLPPAPATVPQQHMTISVPLRFDIR